MTARHFTPILLLLAAFVSGCAQSDREAGIVLASPAGVAIEGYDPVAYFTEGKAARGKPEFSSQHNGATWWFASAAHQELFQADPAKYAPAYGGWCAYGMAEGYAAETDPANGWSIHEGRLYLNWDAEISKAWNADRDRFLEKSEANWPGVNSQLGQGTATVYWHE